MLEKRVLRTFKAIDAGRTATKTKSEGGSTGKKKGLKAVNRKRKSVKPMITWVDLEDEADDLLHMDLEDEGQKTESALEDI
jgi:hypothetical protein